MSAFEVERPILNGPLAEPAEHSQVAEGEAPVRAQGRRAAAYFYRDPKAPPPEPGVPARGAWQELELVNLIRERFLFSRNRLNVAVARARCLAYVVASPRLLEVGCRSIEQMRMANALCLFAEEAVPFRR